MYCREYNISVQGETMIAEPELSEDIVTNNEVASSFDQQQQQQQQQPQQPAPQSSGNPDDGDSESAYHLKWIPWNLGKIPIVMQSINGPCPLIATMNVLLLREKVKLPDMLEQITESQLLTYIGECIMDSIPPELQSDENALLNLEQNIHDAIEILPKLKTGLDVNIRFTGITDFEYTPECIIFDLLRIPLFHGWLCDPNLTELKNAIGKQSYNQLIDNIITNKTSQDPDKLTNILIAEEFLDSTASQLTLHGLHELKTKIKENEIDHGYLTEDNIIWETLDNIEGAGRFFDSNFQTADTTNKQVSELKSIDKRQRQLENDFLMALSLSKNDSLESGTVVASTSNYDADNQQALTSAEPCPIEDDFELAKRLQAEEYKASGGGGGGNNQAVVKWKPQDSLMSDLEKCVQDCLEETLNTKQVPKVDQHKPSSLDHGEWPRESFDREFPPLAQGTVGGGVMDVQRPIESSTRGGQQMMTPASDQVDPNVQYYDSQRFGVQPASQEPYGSPEPSLGSNVPRYETSGGGGDGGYSVSRQQTSFASSVAASATASRSQDDLPASNRLASGSNGRRSRGGDKNTKDSNCCIS